MSGSDDCVLLTGATGSLGHRVLADLLGRGVRCAVLARGAVSRSVVRLRELLVDVGVDVERELADGRLLVVEGDLECGSSRFADVPIRAIVHVAAATNFDRNATGDPARTNVGGTRNVLRSAAVLGVDEFHLVSSAYTCGRTEEAVPESFDPRARVFHNDYEESKWAAEQLCAAWGRGAGRRVTVYRPSIIVGDFSSGRATKFDGFYLSARATELLNRVYENRSAEARGSIPLRIRGRSHDRQNIVPVDYVAKMIGCVVREPVYQGRTYHLVHPDPPTNGAIKSAFEAHFQIGGGRFVDPDAFCEDDLNDHERQFCDVTKPIEHYFVDTPEFARDHAAAVETATGVTCPLFDAPAISRLVRYAESVGWKWRGKLSVRDGSFCARYFEDFLPSNVHRSRVAEMTAVSATVRFVIEDEPNGEWTCRFDRGALADVRRGHNGVREDFGYRTTRDVFFDAISGRLHPQEFFLTGRAEIFGDVERALKMAMILHAFTNEFPCVGEPANVD